MHSACKKTSTANSPTMHTCHLACTYLCISIAPVIITDGAPLALKKELHTTLIRRATTHKTNWRGSLSEPWFWNVRNKLSNKCTTSFSLTKMPSGNISRQYCNMYMFCKVCIHVLGTLECARKIREWVL